MKRDQPTAALLYCCCKRRTYFFGHLVKYGNCWSDSPLRLFGRECRYQTRRVHADIVSKRKVAHQLHLAPQVMASMTRE